MADLLIPLLILFAIVGAVLVWALVQQLRDLEGGPDRPFGGWRDGGPDPELPWRRWKADRAASAGGRRQASSGRPTLPWQARPDRPSRPRGRLARRPRRRSQRRNRPARSPRRNRPTQLQRPRARSQPRNRLAQRFPGSGAGSPPSAIGRGVPGSRPGSRFRGSAEARMPPAGTRSPLRVRIRGCEGRGSPRGIGRPPCGSARATRPPRSARRPPARRGSARPAGGPERRS